ncbi:hypothetical protein M422DRAFT_274131 [Sphaerobolus stellatus SS14]|uniref:Unplaced genomic scaffold SPHSTscaffold_368, whole genome shotgun sequence n=1 Tax=Sphaerobolus stellatus (strain SS14) TaxID=990650 RepID=A0A0C9UIE7_SPHS4|nr:hypothetical protein M422DRAFT_274131 [Sphaerobolus stellatus SS14]
MYQIWLIGFHGSMSVDGLQSETLSPQLTTIPGRLSQILGLTSANDVGGCLSQALQPAGLFVVLLRSLQRENHTRGAPNRLQSRSAGKSSQIAPPCLTPLLALSVESYLRPHAITFLYKLSFSRSLYN